jgi:hypothetical protein
LSAFAFVHVVSGEVPGISLVIGELLLVSGALLAVRTVRAGQSKSAIKSLNQATGVG